jgi:hypothetical protein
LWHPIPPQLPTQHAPKIKNNKHICSYEMVMHHTYFVESLYCDEFDLYLGKLVTKPLPLIVTKPANEEQLENPKNLETQQSTP